MAIPKKREDVFQTREHSVLRGRTRDERAQSSCWAVSKRAEDRVLAGPFQSELRTVSGGSVPNTSEKIPMCSLADLFSSPLYTGSALGSLTLSEKDGESKN